VQDEAFPDVVARLLAMRQAPANCLRVEITEAAIMSGMNRLTPPSPGRASRLAVNPFL
jgi:hypothetical protein